MEVIRQVLTPGSARYCRLNAQTIDLYQHAERVQGVIRVA